MLALFFYLVTISSFQLAIVSERFFDNQQGFQALYIRRVQRRQFQSLGKARDGGVVDPAGVHRLQKLKINHEASLPTAANVNLRKSSFLSAAAAEIIDFLSNLANNVDLHSL